MALEVGEAGQLDAEIADSSVTDIVDPAVNGDGLAAGPGGCDHGGLGDVEDLLDDV